MNAFAISRLGTVLGRETLVREVDGWILRLVGQAGGRCRSLLAPSPLPKPARVLLTLAPTGSLQH